jgi:hypothetical protein
MLSFSCLVASRAVFLITGEVLATGHDGHRVGRLPQPRKGHGCGLHRLRIIPVLSVRQIMHRSAFLGNAGELHAAAMAAPPSPPSTPVAASLSLLLPSNLGRPF